MPQRVVDLTLPFDDRNPRVRTEPLTRLEEVGWNITRVTFDTHAGTHLDAPCHQLPGGTSLDEMDLAKCMGPAFVCDLRHVAPFADLEPEHFVPWADRIVPGSRVIYRTNWSDRRLEPDYRQGFPCPSVRCAEWLADRGIVLLGMDTPSVGPVYRTPRDVIDVHTPLLKAGVVIVEELSNLAALGDLPFHFVALPLRLTNGDGSPVRAVAVLD